HRQFPDMSWTPVIDAGHAATIDAMENRCLQASIEPTRGIARKSRIDRQTLDELLANRPGGGVQDPEMRPWGLRIDVIRRNGRQAPCPESRNALRPCRKGAAIRFRA